MSETDHFFDDATSTREQLIQAAYYALSEHGYSNLTLEKIGEEFEKSTSLVYHHYDGKDALMVELLEYLLQQFKSDVPLSTRDPTAQLHEVIDHVYSSDEESVGFDRALVELRAQAAHNEEFRDLFERTDALVQHQLAQIISAGVEDGTFVDVDPDQTAAALFVNFIGGHTAKCTADAETTAAAKAELERFVDDVLVD